jgi:linoleate 10R-lipoxygenase
MSWISPVVVREDSGAPTESRLDRSLTVEGMFGSMFQVMELTVRCSYFALLDDVRGEMHRKAIQQAIFHNIEHTGPIARHIESKTRALIHQKSFTLVGTNTRCIDIVKDVVNLAPIHWIADALVWIDNHLRADINKTLQGLPLKTHDHMNGTIFEQQADQMFKDIYA